MERATPGDRGDRAAGHILSLRKALGPDVIATRRPGYVLEVDPAQIDLARFEQLRREARRALEHGDADAGADKLREALGLWRGDALADVGFEPSIQAEAARLEDLRLAALEDRIDAELTVGRSADLVDELERLVAANPLREHLWAQLMLVLYRSGRQADALDAYRRARKTLVSGARPRAGTGAARARTPGAGAGPGPRPRTAAGCARQAPGTDRCDRGCSRRRGWWSWALRPWHSCLPGPRPTRRRFRAMPCRHRPRGECRRQGDPAQPHPGSRRGRRRRRLGSEPRQLDDLAGLISRRGRLGASGWARPWTTLPPPTRSGLRTAARKAGTRVR